MAGEWRRYRPTCGAINNLSHFIFQQTKRRSITRRPLAWSGRCWPMMDRSMLFEPFLGDFNGDCSASILLGRAAFLKILSIIYQNQFNFRAHSMPPQQVLPTKTPPWSLIDRPRKVCKFIRRDETSRPETRRDEQAKRAICSDTGNLNKAPSVGPLLIGIKLGQELRRPASVMSHRAACDWPIGVIGLLAGSARPGMAAPQRARAGCS